MKIIPLVKILLFLIVVFSSSFALTYSEDGTYKLNTTDSIISSNDFTVTVTKINWHYDTNQQIIFDNAVYSISYGESIIATPTLSETETYTASSPDSKKNVTVTAVHLDYANNPEGGPIVPYVNTKVKSTTYKPPEPIIDIKFSSITSTPGLYDVKINWSTNTSSNGTLQLRNISGGVVWKTALDSSISTDHSIYIVGLKSNTYYYFTISACTEKSCITSDEKTFITKPVIPVISKVNATPEDTTATIEWYTDVPSNAIVYYRKKGNTAWIRVPPADIMSINDLQKYFVSPDDNTKIINPVKTSGTNPVTLLEGKVTIFAAYNGVVYDSGVGKYIDPEIIKLVVKQKHTIKLSSLKNDTTYEYFVQSCVDQCSNSTIEDAAGYIVPIKVSKNYRVIGAEDYLTFHTKLTLTAPDIQITADNTNIQHGSSVTLTMSRKAVTPGAYLVSSTLKWNDNDGQHTLIPLFQKFDGSGQTFVPDENTAVASVTFIGTGSHTITFSVTDNYSSTSSKDIAINVLANSACSATGAKYYPSDTPCTDKWPNQGGAGINYNSGIGACHATEVCSNDLDYMNADAESCCNGERVFSDKPQQIAYDYDKNDACDAAISNTKKKKPMTSLDATNSMKICKASYLVYAIGSKAVYLKDYYTAEFCCSNNDNLCSKKTKFQAGDPWPQSNIKMNALYCYYTHYDIFFDSWNEPKKGWWTSDSNPSGNNNAAVDAPAHSSVNIMNTGSCVDYSFVVTTALRKSGFTANEIMSVRAPGHLYNAVWLPGDDMYTFIDTVGNTGGDFFSGQGWKWSGNKTNHCSYDACSNDLGMITCPKKGTEMAGC